MSIQFDAVVDDFWAARARGEYFPKAYFDRLNLDEAYRIQLALVDRRVAAGAQHIGWKVGLTAKAIQDQFSIYEPVFGCILEAQTTGHVFGAQELINPGFETELCMRLSRDLDGPATIQEVRESISVIHPAFEVVETRGDLIKQTAVGLADNAQQRSIVLGEPLPLGDLDLESVEAQVFLNGQDLARGFGSAVLGDPLQSIIWLAGKLPRFGRKLRAGDIVMTGSFVRQFPLTPGDRVRATFSGVGEVEFGVAAS
jgi:2-keto-4-pentenoate hydratase